MLRDFLNALVALIFYSTLYIGSSEICNYFRVEVLKSSQKGLGSMQKFNRRQTKKTYDWEAEAK